MGYGQTQSCIRNNANVTKTPFCFVKKVINVTVVFLRERSQGRRTAI